MEKVGIMLEIISELDMKIADPTLQRLLNTIIGLAMIAKSPIIGCNTVGRKGSENTKATQLNASMALSLFLITLI
jgi:hypothetical protein